MENFQLYRTNILLSGQVKWDLILDSSQNGDLIVSDFHLSPVSRSAPYNRLPHESLLNYSHQENLKKFYKSTESSFFDTCIDPQLKHDWVILDDDKKIIYEDSFEAGPRNSYYHIYGKPIEIFCPVWLEHVSKSLSFIVDVYTINGKKIASKNINITAGEFGKYLYNYLNFLGIDRGIDDVLDINFKNKTSFLTGVSLDSGNIVKKDISNIIYNLLYRERTLLEVDAMLINNFANNRIITRQLFNFCFYLNMDDILSSYMSQMLYGNKLNFKIRTFVDGKELELRDFYSNYEYIQREIIQDKTISEVFNGQDPLPQNPKFNVLDYLLDYRYINHINKNKYTQNTIHWSLNNNKDYIFNIYNGFGPYDTNLDVIYTHRYGKTPDLLYSNYNKTLNNIGWCNSVTIDNIYNWNMFINNDEYYDKLKIESSNFKSEWVNNVWYTEYSQNFTWDELKMIIIIADDDIYNTITSQAENRLFAEYKYLTDDDKLCYIKFKTTDEFIGLIVHSNYLNYVTFKGFSDILKKLESDEIIVDNTHPLWYINKKLSTVKQIPLIAINKSLYIVNTPSPSMSTNEIEYYKDDNASIEECYILRYDGKIKPTFITITESISKNLKYFKTGKSESEYINSSFKDYVGSNFSPLFPSIGYCALEKSEPNFDRWNAYIPLIQPRIDVLLQSEKDENGNLKKIKTLILEYLSKIYPNLDSKTIYNMYDIQSSYDYINEYNIKEYSYQINMMLK